MRTEFHKGRDLVEFGLQFSPSVALQWYVVMVIYSTRCLAWYRLFGYQLLDLTLTFHVLNSLDSNCSQWIELFNGWIRPGIGSVEHFLQPLSISSLCPLFPQVNQQSNKDKKANYPWWHTTQHTWEGLLYWKSQNHTRDRRAPLVSTIRWLVAQRPTLL